MKNNDKDYLNNLRHSCSHLLAAAVMAIWPQVKPAIGPAIEDGFYYDFDFGSVKISENDLPKIEDMMRVMVKDWESFERVEIDKNKAIEQCNNNEYKKELIEEFTNEGKQLTLYRSGDFVDLCRGGHCEHPDRELQHFKLLSIAGAYWRGSEKNKMLTRIYGTCFPTKEELDKYLWQQEEAKKRDHRKIGRELDLFAFSDLVGAGLPMFTPKGTVIRQEIENFVRSLQEPLGYQAVTIPHLARPELYKVSGHWYKYKDNMFSFSGDEKSEKFVVKPMNCPHHIQLYASRPRSYRDLPQRYAEVTSVYRNEHAGQLLGLTRVYMITQDDAHVFCTEDQAIEECLTVYNIIKRFYDVFGFSVGMKVRMSLKDPEHPEKYLGDDALWRKAEAMMREVAQHANMDVYDAPGEAAFYGPKLDFMAYDSLGREWQLATIQLDLNFPERFGLEYIDQKGSPCRPVMIHRAISGSVERFMSILIEHYAGAFPLWLAPVQVALIPIAERHGEHAVKTLEELKRAGIRAELDSRNESMQAKIRDATLQKIPYMAIIGDREIQDGRVSVRNRSGEDLGAMSLEQFVRRLHDQIERKASS